MSATQYTIPIRDALVTMMQSVKDSGLKQVISHYIRLAVPSMARDDIGEQHFPVPIRPTKRSKGRRCSQSRFGDVLVFHINRALIGFYALIDDRGTLEDEAHIRRLLIIGSGLNFYRVVGGDFDGFHLLTDQERLDGHDPIDLIITMLKAERGFDESGEENPDDGLVDPEQSQVRTHGTGGRPRPPKLVAEQQVPDSRGEGAEGSDVVV